MNENLIEFLDKEPLDTWYREMSEKPEVKPEDEPMVGLMEWVDLMVEFRR
jgi:hypothetical protein